MTADSLDPCRNNDSSRCAGVAFRSIVRHDGTLPVRERTIEMMSIGMDLLVKDRIRERFHEADQVRLARTAGANPNDTSARPPRGPLFAGFGRIVARLAHVA
jgi:hypothetical protein